MSEAIGVVGLGYVGLPLALLASEKGYNVIGIDNDEDKIKKVNSKKLPFYDKELQKQLKKYPLRATSNYSSLLVAKTIVICVPTPVDADRMPDLNILRNATIAVAKNMAKGQLIIIESTINPGVCDEILIPLLESNSGLRVNYDFYLAHCPERINPGDTKWSIRNIPRVLGGSSKKSLDLAHKFYSSILDASLKNMASIKEAEAVKIVENSFRDINIAFVNELAMSFDKLGIDVVNVIEGAATKPFSFMAHFPGIGVGGHCIPVDPYYLIEYAKNNGFTHKFLSVAREINSGMPEYVVNNLKKLLIDKNIEPSVVKVAVLGLSYKPDVGDTRESPSLKVISLLQQSNIAVIATDPYIDKIEGVNTILAKRRVEIMNILHQVDVAIVATAHAQYKKLTVDDFRKAGTKIVIDGRNCLDNESFRKCDLIYKGIGR